MFYALAIVCDDFFVPSLEKICEVRGKDREPPTKPRVPKAVCYVNDKARRLDGTGSTLVDKAITQPPSRPSSSKSRVMGTGKPVTALAHFPKPQVAVSEETCVP